MKKHLKWIIPVICVVLAVTVGSGYFVLENKRVPTKIQYIHASSLINHYNPKEVVGSKKYVFVGYVTETYDYFTKKDKRKFPLPVTEYNGPMTECVVKVVKNIKGNLTEDTIFSFYKGGGVSENREYIELLENDFIPEVGKYYIFTGHAYEDGTVIGGGSNGTIELESGINADNLKSSKLYQEYVDAVKNQILPIYSLSPDYRATIDRDYGDGSYNKQVYQDDLIRQAETEKRYQVQLEQLENELSQKEQEDLNSK